MSFKRQKKKKGLLTPKDREQLAKQQTEDLMRIVGDMMKEVFPGFGFTVLVFKFGEEGHVNYVSNAKRPDMINSLKDGVKQLTELEGDTEIKVSQPNIWRLFNGEWCPHCDAELHIYTSPTIEHGYGFDGDKICCPRCKRTGNFAINDKNKWITWNNIEVEEEGQELSYDAAPVPPKKSKIHMRGKYIDEKAGIYFVFGNNAGGGVDINDGNKDVFENVPLAMAEKICEAQAIFRESLYEIFNSEGKQ